MLVSGSATLTLFDGDSARDVVLKPGEAYAIEPGTVHRVAGHSVDDAVILEISTTELADVVRLEDDYGR